MRCIIVDDEYPSREELKYFIKNYSNMDIVKEFDDSLAALKFLEGNKVDLIFLDINMPNLDGMCLGKIVNKFEKKPIIVFITAYKEYAIEAFEIEAVDYILKPYSEERIINTIKRIEKNYRENEEPRGNRSPLSERITLWRNDKMKVINIEDICYCEVKERDTIVYTGSEEYIANMSISSFYDKLPEEKFFKSHRGFIINIDKVVEIIPWFNNTYNVKLRGVDVQIPVSRSKVKAFRRIMRI
ncbi:LytR/AlgR family response regulator transcription factor [Wukongibacter sp. M2B1]|uniref:LytR/AlgR family response regulator transcription factor n=1 Tax=Wukongibacter sp. M2B1 TaxID=3088895 RepID=UPI003D7AC7D5